PRSGCADRDVTIDISDFDPGGGLRGSWSVDLGAQLVGGDVDATRCAYEPLDKPARSIRLSEVTVNQGVAIPLAQNGTVVSAASRKAPIVAGRDAVFQIGVTPEADWQPREIVVEVQLDGVAVAESRATVSTASDSSDPEAMIQVPVSGEELEEGATFSVGLFEIASCVDQAGGVTAPRVPASGTTELGAESLAGPFRIVLVPIRWNTDGSGRLPDLSPGVVQEFADGVASLYPVTGVDVTVRNQPLDYGGALDAGGNGWSQLLNECLSLRSSDNGPDEVYYYCLFQPTPTARDFCSGGCVAGIGPVPSASDTYRRAAIGIGFNGSGVDTFLHEIGHALGRPHAPCGGASGADPGYPYADAAIGVWGYDLTSDSHISPDYRDLMSYCGPNWISDYNYDLLFDRIASVYGRQFALKSITAPALPSVSYRTVVVDADMTLSWGRDTILERLPDGEPVTAELLNTSGQVVARVPGVYQSVTHIPGGMLLWEDVETAASSVHVEGFGTLAF
ncbi:MAG: M66 family metalloprotease, partial [Polyangiales bacterium]